MDEMSFHLDKPSAYLIERKTFIRFKEAHCYIILFNNELK